MAIEGFRRAYPGLSSRLYPKDGPDLDEALAGADLVIVHEWTDRELVRRIGEHRRRRGRYKLLFHDTHHRAVSAPDQLPARELEHFDGVLAYGRVLRNLWLARGWAKRAWTWHEAADSRVFRPHRGIEKVGDLVWIGNWGDGERTEELREFLIEPVMRLGLRARVYGVRYPREAIAELDRAGIEYGGWLPNHEVPHVFARFRVTIHVPRRFYSEALPGIPTIRPFEALACGIPLVSAPWQDTEGLFRAGLDFRVAYDGSEMERHISRLLSNPADAQEMARRGRETILARHTCMHRVDELLAIVDEIDAELRAPSPLRSATHART